MKINKILARPSKSQKKKKKKKKKKQTQIAPTTNENGNIATDSKGTKGIL